MSDDQTGESGVWEVSRRDVVAGTGLATAAALTGAVPASVEAQSADNFISGTVTDPDGNAVQGAVVDAVPHDSSLDVLRTTTDANGDYSFTESDLYTGDELYHVICRNGTQSSPEQATPNYPFVEANGGTGVTIIDDFEDGDKSEYGNDPEPANWSVQQGTVLEGSYSLEGDSGDGSAIGISSTTGLNYYPSQGDVFRSYFQGGSGPSRGGPFYFVQSQSGVTPEGYHVRMDIDGDSMVLYRTDSSGNFASTLGSTSVTLSNGTLYDIEMSVNTSDQHEITLYNSSGTQLASLGPFSDSTYSSGGWGWFNNPAGSAANSFYDFARKVGDV